MEQEEQKNSRTYPRSHIYKHYPIIYGKKPMDESLISKAQSLTPEGIQKLQKLKTELEMLSSAIQNMENKSKYEVEDRIRAFKDKELEIKSFLRGLGMLT
ncbi:MAG: hypothetical protein HQL68_00565 [Magnetococcales bacterium]|nr:hypothetical protein [Magnetococcales bacterium]